jgi:hypothetical protein
MLMMRRHEKDFIMRLDPKYAALQAMATGVAPGRVRPGHGRIRDRCRFTHCLGCGAGQTCEIRRQGEPRSVTPPPWRTTATKDAVVPQGNTR